MFDGLFLCQKSYFQVRNVSIVALHDVNEGGTTYMGISPGKTSSGRMPLKKGIFGCEGKIALFSFPSL